MHHCFLRFFCDLNNVTILLLLYLFKFGVSICNNILNLGVGY